MIQQVIDKSVKEIQEELGEGTLVVVGVFDGEEFRYAYTHSVIYAAGLFAAINANFNKKLAEL